MFVLVDDGQTFDIDPRKVLLIEVVSRALKSILRHWLRHVSGSGISGGDPQTAHRLVSEFDVKLLVVSFLNLVSCDAGTRQSSENASRFWNEVR